MSSHGPTPLQSWCCPSCVLQFRPNKQSVLIAVLMHAAFNAAGGVTVLWFEGADRVKMYCSMTAVTAVVAMAVLSTQARWRLSKPHLAHESIAVETADALGRG